MTNVKVLTGQLEDLRAVGISRGYRITESGALEIPETPEGKALYTEMTSKREALVGTLQQAETRGVITKTTEGYIPGKGMVYTPADVWLSKYTKYITPTEQGMAIWQRGTARMEAEVAKGPRYQAELNAKFSFIYYSGIGN